jgi:DNA end-binding protein Ku
MPRSIWTGAISFGLVNVPVKLYSAVSRKTVRFHQLHDADGVRIQQKRVCPADGEEVSYEHIVKGYEIAPDRYVVVSPDELDALDPVKTKTIDIEDFVDLAEIDPLYYDHPYYLAPGTGAAKSYSLLLDAMREASKVAIARVVIRQKEQLCAIRATDRVLTMSTMLFGDEVVPPDALDELQDAQSEASERELTMAQQLIGSLTSEFDPSKYHDDYRERVLELIERKAQGEEIAVRPEPEEPARVPDLMAALEASIAAVQERGQGRRREAAGDGKQPAKDKGGRAPAKGGRASAKGGSTRQPAKKS